MISALDLDLHLNGLIEHKDLPRWLGSEVVQCRSGGNVVNEVRNAMSTETELAGYEISPQQRRIWLRQTEDFPLTASILLELVGRLDTDHLRRSLDKIVARHEILRTTFRGVPGRQVPVQVVHDSLPVQWRQISDKPTSPDDEAEFIERIFAEPREISFNLESGPIIHATLLQLQSNKHMLQLCIPLLCADTASLQLIGEQLVDVYAGNAFDMEHEALQYADVSDWQNQLLENVSEGQVAREYWRHQTLAAPTVVLPFEARPIEIATFHQTSIVVDVDAEIVSNLGHTAERDSLPTSSLLCGCWLALLSRLTDIQDILIYTASNGRRLEDLANAVGPLEKWLPVQVVFDSSTPIERIWGRINKTVSEAVTWEQYWNWNSDLNETLSDPSPADRFGFQFDDFVNIHSSADLRISQHICSCSLEPFKLVLACHLTSGGITLEFRYDTNRYSSEVIRRLADSYIALLQSALTKPDSHVGSLNLLSDKELQTILVDWNHTEQAFVACDSIHTLFEEAAVRSPDEVALRFEHGQLTYSQLNTRANQLANQLIQEGVTPGARVGLYLQRGLDLIVGLLGILKSGGAYVPLDPAMPPERLEWMTADSEISILVTQTELAHLNTSGVKLVLLDGDEAGLEKQCTDNTCVAIATTHIAYVIYTSGSTGRPKGVAIEHGNLLNYVQGILHRLELPARSSYATVSTIAADLGNTTVFAALCSGGCLHILSQECAMDAAIWQSYWKDHTIDCLKIVPSHLEALLASGGYTSDMLPRKALVLGGEASGWELIHHIAEASPTLRVFNHYGPTETTVGVLTYPVTEDHLNVETRSTTVPIGRPLPNSRAYILNSYRQPMPVGAAGEIYIGGAGVGSGYLNQPDLTSQKFVDDPFCTESGARLYRTGDLARYLPDGNIEFLGRADNQVKIRGYRIELGEIESVIMQYPRVRSAVVLIREDTPGVKRLVGYVVFEDASSEGAALLDHLRSHLPDYMVPGNLVELSSLPLTLNGKLDRNALPAPEEICERDFVAPRNSVETVLAEIWEELLRRNPVSVTDNFFDIGGHSLLATQVISRVRETFQIDVPLRALFDSPSIATFGDQLLLDPAASSRVERMADMLVSLNSLTEEELDAELCDLEATGEVTWS